MPKRKYNHNISDQEAALTYEDYDVASLNSYSSSDDECQVPVRSRKRFRPHEISILEDMYQHCEKPSTEIKQAVASRFNTKIERIQIWFQNRRAKEKKLKTQEHPSRGSSPVSVGTSPPQGTSTVTQQDTHLQTFEPRLTPLPQFFGQEDVRSVTKKPMSMSHMPPSPKTNQLILEYPESSHVYDRSITPPYQDMLGSQAMHYLYHCGTYDVSQQSMLAMNPNIDYSKYGGNSIDPNILNHYGRQTSVIQEFQSLSPSQQQGTEQPTHIVKEEHIPPQDQHKSKGKQKSAR
ncbi:hypothetical protein CU098_012633 [Rhizopus stolonifer]|uniref:Homeobox domain-containing protein n=1 Tax=Rhizopus stolonifer TaxID=4846 RepID=A0A367KRT6_RHIST|nr:hypothetical protein CU098_012633 [Rhizopus stolonifer]